MIRAVVLWLLAALLSLKWLQGNAAPLAWAGWCGVRDAALDPAHVSPVVVGGALAALCAAALFRHVTAWLLAYLGLLSVPTAAFVTALALAAPANTIVRDGTGEAQRGPAERAVRPPPSTPSVPSVPPRKP